MALAFSRILLAYDDSAGSRLALDYACALTRDGATLTIAHAVNELSIASATTSAGLGAIDPVPLMAALNDEGAAILQAAVDLCAEHGVIAEPVFLHDSPIAGILELEQTKHVDLIVLGTHARRGIARVALGSVAAEILRASDVPVLVVTSHAERPREPLFARALVALDDSAPSLMAMSVAGRLHADLNTHCTLCNVVDSPSALATAARASYGESSLETSLFETSMKLLRAAAAASDIPASGDDLAVVEGSAAAAIEHTARQRNCDLIVIGSHGRSGLQRLLLGSVAEAVVRGSALPVLVVPAKKRAPLKRTATARLLEATRSSR